MRLLAVVFIDQEQEAGAGGDEDLGVVAAFGKEAVARVEGGFEFVGMCDRVAEDRSAEGVEGAGGGVDHDEALVGEGAGKEAREGGGKGGAGGVTGGKEIEFRGASDELGGAIEEGDDAGAEREIADGTGNGVGTGATGVGGVVALEPEGIQSVTRGEGDVVCFGEVVIFRGEPEDGDGASILGAAEDGGGFEEGVEGSGEEGDLLAGEDGAGPLAESLDVGDGFGGAGRGVGAGRGGSGLAWGGETCGGGAWRGKPGPGLVEQEVGEGIAVGGIEGGDGLGPGGGPRRGGEEGCEGLVARGVVEEEPALPGEERDGIAVDLHGRT